MTASSSRKIKSGIYDISTQVRARWLAYTIETSNPISPTGGDCWRTFDTEAEAGDWLQDRLAGVSSETLETAQ